MKTALVVLAEGFETIEALTPVDVLRRLGVKVTVAGLGGLEITSAHKVTVKADALLAPALAPVDAIVLPGGLPGAVHFGESALLQEMATAQLARGGIVAAICAAPAKTLARWGLLSGKTATCYPGCEAEFPADARYVEAPVVVDGPVVTSRGPATALPFAYRLAGLLLGDAAVADLQRKMLYA